MKPLSILVVDDHAATREVLELWLKLHGHAVACAKDGTAARRALERRSIDLVLTDILMPHGDGATLISALRANHPQIRIVAISGGGPSVTSSSCLNRAQHSGAHGLLLKPFRPEQLAEVIRRVMAMPIVNHRPSGAAVAAVDESVAKPLTAE